MKFRGGRLLGERERGGGEGERERFTSSLGESSLGEEGVEFSRARFLFFLDITVIKGSSLERGEKIC